MQHACRDKTQTYDLYARALHVASHARTPTLCVFRMREQVSHHNHIARMDIMPKSSRLFRIVCVCVCDSQRWWFGMWPRDLQLRHSIQPRQWIMPKAIMEKPPLSVTRPIYGGANARNVCFGSVAQQDDICGNFHALQQQQHQRFPSKFGRIISLDNFCPVPINSKASARGSRSCMSGPKL